MDQETMSNVLSVIISSMFLWIFAMATVHNFEHKKIENEKRKKEKDNKKEEERKKQEEGEELKKQEYNKLKSEVVDQYMNSHKYGYSDIMVTLIQIEKSPFYIKNDEFDDLCNCLINSIEHTSREKDEFFRKFLVRINS